MKYIYSKDIIISYSMVDRTGKLGLFELMNLTQDMVTEFCGSIGSDNGTLKEQNNAAWVYTRAKVKINSLPFWNAKAKAVIYISSLSSIRMELETDLFDENGSVLAIVKTEMCAIDLTERRVRKVDSISFPKDAEVSPSDFSESFTRIKNEFDAAELIYSQRVFAADTDYSKHTNNAQYVKYIMNTMDAAFYEEKTITDFEIQYVKESKDADVLDVVRELMDEGQYCFAIKNEDRIVIKAIMKYQPKKF